MLTGADFTSLLLPSRGRQAAPEIQWDCASQPCVCIIHFPAATSATNLRIFCTQNQGKRFPSDHALASCKAEEQLNLEFIVFTSIKLNVLPTSVHFASLSPVLVSRNLLHSIHLLRNFEPQYTTLGLLQFLRLR